MREVGDKMLVIKGKLKGQIVTIVEVDQSDIPYLCISDTGISRWKFKYSVIYIGDLFDAES